MDSEQFMSWEAREHQRLMAYLEKHGEAHSVTLSTGDGGEFKTEYHPTPEAAATEGARLALAWGIAPPTFWQRVFGRKSWPEPVLAEYEKQKTPTPDIGAGS